MTSIYIHLGVRGVSVVLPARAAKLGLFGAAWSVSIIRILGLFRISSFVLRISRCRPAPGKLGLFDIPRPGRRQSPNPQSLNSNLQLTLFWQPLVPLSTDYTRFVHLRNESGATVAQGDGRPLDGAYPTSRWQPDELVIDPITLPLPDDLPPGQYSLFTGLYQLDTLARLPVIDDATGENAIFLGEVTLP